MKIDYIYHKIVIATLVVLYLACESVIGASVADNATLRDIQLRGGESYADHISFMTGDDEVDLIVKLRFDESANTLTVSALSYFNLLGFEQDVRYGSIIKRRKFKCDKMPYVMESDPAAKYKTTRKLRSGMKPHKRHSIFSSWVEAKGASFEMGKYNVVNDYLERCYNVSADVSNVEVLLHDMLVMDSPEKSSKKRVRYDIFAKQDLNINYKVELLRDPCLGEDEALESSATALNNIMKSYGVLTKLGGADPNNRSLDSLNIFNSLKNKMTELYQRSEQHSDCPDVLRNMERYNNYIDSIAVVKGYYLAPEIDPAIVYDAARRVDRYNTKWSLTTDEVEKHDIEAECSELIRDIEAKLEEQDRPSDDLNRAMELFWSAESNFYFITSAQ